MAGQDNTEDRTTAGTSRTAQDMTRQVTGHGTENWREDKGQAEDMTMANHENYTTNNGRTFEIG